MSDIVYVDDNNFELEVLQSKLPVLVDFTAPWCGPCVKQLPIMEKFASENLTRVKVCKIDVDESPSISSKFNVKSVPSIMLFNKGSKLDTKIGMTSATMLNTLLQEKLGI